MAVVPNAGDPYKRGVSVRIGHVQPAVQRRPMYGLCVVGVCLSDAPWLADLVPQAVVRETRFRTADGAVEHLRVRARDDLASLPGLDGRAPSRVRDAVAVGLTAGAREVDVVMVRNGGALPWDLDHRTVNELLEPFLDELPGSVVVFPDLGGPTPTGPGTEIPSEERTRRFVRSIRRLAPGLVQRYQVGLVDTPPIGAREELDLLRGVVGADVAMCCWKGDTERLRAHAWRSAAAAVGGLLGGDAGDVGRGVAGRTVNLPAGRVFARSRARELTLSRSVDTPTATDESVIQLRLHPTRDRAEMLTEPTFRQPVGEWELPALRAVKIIHHQLVRTAQGFVFRNADDAQAVALASALQRTLRPHVNRGMLVGAGGEGLPKVRGGVDAYPGEPGLNAVVTAQLRPWSQRVVVRVAVKPGSRPVLEVQ
jgi:hypothetical protein